MADPFFALKLGPFQCACWLAKADDANETDIVEAPRDPRLRCPKDVADNGATGSTKSACSDRSHSDSTTGDPTAGGPVVTVTADEIRDIIDRADNEDHSAYSAMETTPDGLTVGYGLSEECLRIVFYANYNVDVTTCVAAMAEMDIQGPDPLTQSGRWKGRRSSLSKFIGPDPALLRTTSHPGLRLDLKECTELSANGEPVAHAGGAAACAAPRSGQQHGANSARVTWNTVTKEPTFGVRGDDILCMTLLDLFEEHGGALLVTKPPPPDMEVPACRRWHTRMPTTFTHYIKPSRPPPGATPDSGPWCRLSFTASFHLSPTWRGIFRYLPSAILQSAIRRKVLEVWQLGKGYVANDRLLRRTIESGSRASFYASLRERERMCRERGFN